jgi:hypothetical protein
MVGMAVIRMGRGMMRRGLVVLRLVAIVIVEIGRLVMVQIPAV